MFYLLLVIQSNLCIWDHTGPLSFRSHESSGVRYSDSTRCLWYTQQEKKVFCDLLVHSDLIPLHVVTLTLWGDALQLLILVHGDHNYPFEGISMKSITLQSLVSYMVDLRMESQRLMWWSLPFEEIAHVGQIDVCRVWYVVLWPLCYRVWYIVTLHRIPFLLEVPSQYGCCVCLDCRCACPSL